MRLLIFSDTCTAKWHSPFHSSIAEHTQERTLSSSPNHFINKLKTLVHLAEVVCCVVWHCSRWVNVVCKKCQTASYLRCKSCIMQCAYSHSKSLVYVSAPALYVHLYVQTYISQNFHPMLYEYYLPSFLLSNENGNRKKLIGTQNLLHINHHNCYVILVLRCCCTMWCLFWRG